MVGGEGFEPSKSKTADLQSLSCELPRVVYCYVMSEANQGNIRATDDGEGNTADQGIPGAHQKSAQKMHRWKLGSDGELGNQPRQHGAAKTAAAYWLGKVKKPAGSGLYGVQIAHRGTRHRFPLETANQAAAAEKARKIYLYIVANGFEAALEEFNPKVAAKPAAPATTTTCTIGELITAATRLSSARRESLDTYAKALRRIATGVLAVKGGKSGPKQGTDAWREMIDATPLDRLTPASVLTWKNAFLKSAANPQERNSAAVTVNSLLRNSKALLSKRIRPFLDRRLIEAQQADGGKTLNDLPESDRGILLPGRLWFESVPMEKEPSMRYHSTIDAGTILKAAMDELVVKEPEAFKALLLTLICGLRRSEADSMTWAQINFDAGTLEVRDTDHRALKSADSAGEIALDPEVVALLRGFHATKQGDFVMETPKLARTSFKEHKSRTYRCDATHTWLIEWLRKNGVTGKRPLHTMRKEIGSIIATREGIFAASRFLRHSDIRITSRLYADSKTLVSSGLGSMLATSNDQVVVEGDFKPKDTTTKTTTSTAPRKAKKKAGV